LLGKRGDAAGSELVCRSGRGWIAAHAGRILVYLYRPTDLSLYRLPLVLPPPSVVPFAVAGGTPSTTPGRPGSGSGGRARLPQRKRLRLCVFVGGALDLAGGSDHRAHLARGGEHHGVQSEGRGRAHSRGAAGAGAAHFLRGSTGSRAAG